MLTSAMLRAAGRLVAMLPLVVLAVSGLAAQTDDKPAADQQRMRFKVTGKLDDPLLGKIEDVVTGRLRSLESTDISVERNKADHLDVSFRPTRSTSYVTVMRALNRPDSILVALAATAEEVRAVFGSDDAAVRWMRANSKKSVASDGLSVFANPFDPSRPAKAHEQPVLRYYRWVPGSRVKPEAPGVLVPTRAGACIPSTEIDRVRCWDGKLTAGIGFSIRREHQRQRRGFARQLGDLCVILNGRCALRVPKEGGHVALTALAESGRIYVTTSLFGSDLPGGAKSFREWLKSEGQRRTLTLVQAEARRNQE